MTPLLARRLAVSMLATGALLSPLAAIPAEPPPAAQAPPTASLEALPRVAPELAASEESIRRLLEITGARALIDHTVGQMQSIMDRSLRDATGGELPPAAAGALEEFSKEVVAIVRDELRWDRLEPMYVEIYRRTFTQEEVDGMIAFHDSPVGRSTTGKLPIVQTYTMEIMQSQMASVAPRLRAAQEDFMRRLREMKDRS